MTLQKPYTSEDLSSTSLEQQIIHQDRIWVLNSVLSKQDCDILIENLTALGLELSSVQTNYRSNYRRRIQSPTLSSQIYQKIKDFLKPIRLKEDDYQQTTTGFKLQGLWEPVGLAPDWVFSKYEPGTHFGPHYDGSTIIDFGERSLQTLIIYLNDGCEGGCTNFFDESKQGIDPEDGSDPTLFCGDKENIIYSISPEKGSALLFNHHQIHEGELLRQGYKYILRSDVMYVRRDFPDINPAERQGIDWIIKAQQLEFEKKYQEATVCYKKAYRLWPELAFIRSEI